MQQPPRPPTKYRPVMIRLPEDIYQRVQAMAERQRIPVATVLRALVVEALENRTEPERRS